MGLQYLHNFQHRTKVRLQFALPTGLRESVLEKIQRFLLYKPFKKD